MNTSPIPITLNMEAYNPELPRTLWTAQAACAREVVEDTWRTGVRTLPADLQVDVQLRWADSSGWELYGILGRVPIYFSWSRGTAHVLASGDNHESCQEAVNTLRQLFPETKPEGTRIPITLWASSDGRAEAWARKIDAPAWDDISSNYAASTLAQLERLMRGRMARKSGRLLLWHGLPGTGKTWALRALAYEWRDWCELHYISDPEVFLGAEPAYVLEVALGRERSRPADDSDDEEDEPQPHADKWRLIVLEDAGEMLSVDAKERVGQALSRLLNLTDGILGQGARMLVLITTNEQLGKLHPAVQRPGRCAAVVPFEPLTPTEAQAWLERHGNGSTVRGARTLAELYGILEGVSRPEPRPVGFALPA